MEIERRLFADGLASVQAKHMATQHEANQSMIAARVRAATLAERNESIREVLGERGRYVWTRRLLSLTYHGWKDFHVRARLARIESDYRLRLHQKVEDRVGEERKEHAQALRDLQLRADALGAQLGEVRAASREAVEGVQTELGWRLAEAEAEAGRARRFGEAQLIQWLRDVEMERERRELAEGAMAAVPARLLAAERMGLPTSYF